MSETMANKLDKILGRIAIGGGIFTIGTGFYLYNRLQRQYSYEFYVREPIKLLEGYPYAEQLLGKPISSTNIKFDRENVQVTQLKAKINIPVKGPKGRAMLYSLSERETPDAEWEVKQLDLQLDPKTPKWTFYRQAGPEDSDNIVTLTPQVADSKNSEDELNKDLENTRKQFNRTDTEISKTVLNKTGKNTLADNEDKKKLKWL